MKKIIVLLVSLLCLSMLAGCGDASAKITNPKEVIMTVGDLKVTREEMYSDMMLTDGGTAVNRVATSLIVNAEIENTDEIVNKAKEELETYRAQLDGDLETALSSLGYATEEEFLNAIIDSIKAETLLTKYFNDNKDELYTKYAPLLAKIIVVNTTGELDKDGAKAKANEALEAIKSGKSFDEVAEEYTSNKGLAAETLYTRESSLDTNVLQYLLTVNEPTLSGVIENKNATGYYVIQVTATNKAQVEDKFKASLLNNTDFNNNVYHSLFEKHNFTIYDIETYNNIKNNFPHILVQD